MRVCTVARSGQVPGRASVFLREKDMAKTTQVSYPRDLISLLRLQILVLTLGQPKHFGWWKSEFLSPTGLRYLQRIYPRDFFWAAVRSSAITAKDAHDGAIGVRDAFHLFRLPGNMANALRSISDVDRSTIETDISSILEDPSHLLTLLSALAGNTHLANQVGPARIGIEKDLAKPEAIAQMAYLYHSAFQRSVKTYPYFEQAARKR